MRKVLEAGGQVMGGVRRRGLRPSDFATIVALATFGFCLVLAPPLRAEPSHDFGRSPGERGQDSAGLHQQHLTAPPLSQALEPGVRRAHSFRVADDVIFLRIDPTDAADATVDIYAVAVTDASGTLVRFGPTDLATWDRANVAPVPGDVAAYRFRTTSDDSFLSATPNFILKREMPVWLRPVVQSLRSPDLTLKVSIIGWVVWVVVGARRRGRWAYLPITGVAVASVFWLVPLVAGLPDRPPPVDRAVGRTAVMGQSLRAGQMAVLAAVGATALVGLAAGLVERKQRRREETASRAMNPTPSRPGERRRTLWAAVACVTITASFLPDLGGFLTRRACRSTPLTGMSKTSATGLTWSTEGPSPTGTSGTPTQGLLFDQPAPTGPLLKAAYEALLFCLFALAFYRASSRRVGATSHGDPPSSR